MVHPTKTERLRLLQSPEIDSVINRVEPKGLEKKEHHKNQNTLLPESKGANENDWRMEVKVSDSYIA